MMMVESPDEWIDPQTGELWVNDEKTTTLVEEQDSRISWYRGMPYRKVEPRERYHGHRQTERSQARERGEKARRLCDAEEEWFKYTVEKCSAMMGQLTMKYLGEYDRIGPGFESEVTRTERRISQAFKETSPLKANVKELEK